MPSAQIVVDVGATAEQVFDLIHDYPRRLAWDPFLSAAEVLGDGPPATGVVTRCVARRRLGRWAMETVYVSFQRPRVAAVKMIRGPWFFRQFAASLRHEKLGECESRVTYRYQFACQPRWLRFLLEPVVQWLLKRETAARMAALRVYLAGRARERHQSAVLG